MMPLTLGNVTLPEYHLALVSDHWVNVSVQLLDLEHYYVADVSEDMYEGQVNVDVTGETSRNLSMKILDPEGVYGLDSRSAQNGAFYYDRMLRVVYTVWAWWMANPVSCVVFCGPISMINRDGLFINVEAKGKEYLALGDLWTPRPYKKGRSKHSILMDLLVNALGEDHYDIPQYEEIKKGITDNKTLGREDKAWPYMVSLAESAGLNLFYDGRGICRLRKTSLTPVFTFKTGLGGSIITDPQVSYDDEYKNKIWLIGGKPKGSKKVIEVTATAPASHELNPIALGRNGKPFYRVEKIENSDFRTKTSAQNFVNKTLNERLIQATHTVTDTLVIPHLDPYDYANIQTEDFLSPIQLRQFSIPLSPEGNNSVGATKNVSQRSVPNRLKRSSRRV